MSTLPATASILIVDDDEFMLEVLSETLGLLETVAIRTCMSAEAALDSIDCDDPDLIVLCDLYMPGMDGVELLRHLSTHHFRGSVALVSGEDARTVAMVERVVRGHRLRFLGVLHKPVSPEQLAELLSRVHRTAGPGGPANPAEALFDRQELADAIAGDQLFPVFQPKVNIATGAVHGFEVLARWRHPQRGLIPPSVFIPHAEQSGLIQDLTDAIVSQALAQWAAWHAEGFTTRLAINLSMVSLRRLDLPDWLARHMGAVGMPTENLMLELTEGSAMEGVTSSFDVLARLCLKRLQLSIDDFGTAYSNLEKLQMLPFRELKIDQSFVRGALTVPLSRIILETSAALGRQLEMTVVAEGVETQAHWDIAAAAGCDLVQGYFISRPLAAADVLPWMRSRAPRTAA